MTTRTRGSLERECGSRNHQAGRRRPRAHHAGPDLDRNRRAGRDSIVAHRRLAGDRRVRRLRLDLAPPLARRVDRAARDGRHFHSHGADAAGLQLRGRNRHRVAQVHDPGAGVHLDADRRHLDRPQRGRSAALANAVARRGEKTASRHPAGVQFAAEAHRLVRASGSAALYRRAVRAEIGSSSGPAGGDRQRGRKHAGEKFVGHQRQPGLRHHD